MPDKPDYNRHPHPAGWLSNRPAKGRGDRGTKVRRYAELSCKSNFSFLRGASHPEELAERAAELGYAALAITDRNTLAGVVRMHCAAKAFNLKLIVGAEITPVDAPPILLYATDREGYGGLCRIITQGRLREIKGSCAVTLDDIAQWSRGLIAALLDRRNAKWVPRAACPPVACQAGALAASCQWHPRIRSIQAYHEIFGDQLYLAVSVHGGSNDDRHLAETDALACETGLPMLATNDVHYHDPKRRFLQDVLTCIRKRCTLEAAGQALFANAERHLKSVEEMERTFAGCPRGIRRTIEIADRCHFSLDELRYEYPEALCPPGRDPSEFLAELTWAGTRQRYPNGVPDKVRTLIEHELELIRKLDYEPYFLTVWDIVKFARSRNILCQGRGSAANSAVCYCLGITSVDPDRIDLLFERFLSAERNEPPDIDVDFEHERREEVIQYIYHKYGRDHAGIVAEVITYRPRSAIRDVGKALGLSVDCVATLAKKHEWWDKEVMPDDLVRRAGVDPSERTPRMMRQLVQQLVGFPRHLSQHVGGFVITRGPLCEMVPIGNAAMPQRTFIEWDKDDIDALGILKIDCLGLGMLTAIRKCFDTINGHREHASKTSLSLHTIPKNDPAVYDMICHADTVGVFQIESRAQMSMLPRLKPRNYYDLVIEVAIVRPGPIQGRMVHPYLRRRCGDEPVTYPNEAIKEVLKRTLGVPLFQEQAMSLAIVAAGFTPGEADQLRRAMATWGWNGDITRFRRKLIKGMIANGLSEEFAQRCFEQICGFGAYGFPESHAASFALLVYVSSWLKRYYPAVFCAALINSQPMGFYKEAQLVRDAREHGVPVLPVDVNFSGYDCRLEKNGRSSSTDGRKSPVADPTTWGMDGPAVRLGMRLVKGISHAKVESIERAQGAGPFRSVADLTRRSGASRATLARLAAADAMRSMGFNRRQAVWEVLALSDEPPMLKSFEPAEPAPALPEQSLKDVVLADYETIGLSLNAHPMSLVRPELKRMRVDQTRVLKHTRQGQWVRVAGLVLIRQRPSTALGVVFFTLEDETGTANLVIRPRTYEKFRQAAHGAVALLAEGRVERRGEVAHVQVHRLQDLSQVLSELRNVSRDFR